MAHPDDRMRKREHGYVHPIGSIVSSVNASLLRCASLSNAWRHIADMRKPARNAVAIAAWLGIWTVSRPFARGTVHATAMPPGGARLVRS
jgi:hypothetical protein